jgi:FixJ family two-component response regulator
MVTDVIMPVMSGRTLADRLAERRPRMKVLYMSGYTDEIIASRGVLDSGISFLQKPFTPDRLRRKVRAILDGPPALRPADRPGEAAGSGGGRSGPG